MFLLPGTICIFAVFLLRASAEDLQWCSSSGRYHQFKLKDLVPDEEEIKHVKFSFSEGIEQVSPELNQETNQQGVPSEEYTVEFNKIKGIHELNVSYSTASGGGGESEEGGSRHTLTYTVKQLECDYALVYPARVNSTHSKVTCGLNVTGYPAPIIWKKNGIKIPDMRSTADFVFETNDESLDGNYTCTQTFLGDVLTKTTEFFYLGKPGPVRAGHVHCMMSGQGTVRGMPIKFCMNPIIQVAYHHRDPRNANVMAFHVQYQPRTGPSYNETVVPVGHHTLEPLNTTFVFPGVLTTRAVNSYGLQGKPHVEILIV